MDDALYRVLRVLHPLGAFLAFAAAPVALVAIKGGWRHILAGRCFALGMGLGATAGILLSVMDEALDLFPLGILALFFTGTGYLAPRVGRGSRVVYRWDRALTAVGLLASLGLVWFGVLHTTRTAPIQEGVVMGGLGVWVAAAHFRWRGPADPSRWRLEHLTSFLASYTVVWLFVFGLYIRALPPAPRLLIPVGIGVAAILWARRRFAEPSVAPQPGVGALTGVA
jgi:hypothetical protein